MSAKKHTARSHPRAPSPGAPTGAGDGLVDIEIVDDLAGAEMDSASDHDAHAEAAAVAEAGPVRSGAVDAAVDAAFARELAEAYRQADEARAEAAANWDRYLRAEAEIDNLRKRGERMQQDALIRQRRDLLGRFLDVADNLERALAHAEADPSALRVGIEGTYRAVGRMLEREGVARIEAQDAPFDPHLHEAVGVVTLPGLPEERIISVEQAGYTLDGELLRAARVIVGQPADA